MPLTPAERYFSAEEIERARAYHRPLYVSYIVSTGAAIAYLALLAFTPMGRWLAAPVDDLPKWAFVTTYTALILLIGALLRFPLSVWRGFVHEHRWGFSTQSFESFLLDWTKGTAISLVLTSTAMLAFVEIASALPGSWPVVVGLCAAALVVVLSFLAPMVFEPLFNRFRPLEDEALAADLQTLAVQAGVPVRDVLVADASRRTRKENAYVSGLGRTRRVVVFDTLLARGSSRDVRLVVAHELGHRRAHHVAWAALLGAVGATIAVRLVSVALQWHPLLAAAGATSAADPHVVPAVLLAFGVMELYALPGGAALSRWWEAAADRASIELTGDPEGFAEMERNLALSNVLDLAPTPLRYLLLFTHPTPPQRIEAALAAAADRSTPEPSPTTG